MCIAKVEGHSIDLIRRSISSLGEECAIASVASLLRNEYPSIFRPGNWSGYATIKEMFQVLEKHFTLFYKDSARTDLWVRNNGKTSIQRPSQSKQQEISPRLIVNLFLTDSMCEEIARKYEIPSDLRSPSRLRAYFLYYMYRLKAEGKFITYDGACVCNIGLYSNGIHPVYLVVLRNDDGRHRFGLFNRNSKEGRKIIECLGNRTPQAATFPQVVFEYSLQIIPEYAHILEDHPERLPKSLIDMVRAYLPSNASNAVEESDSDVVSHNIQFFERILMGGIYHASLKLRNRTIEPVSIWWKRTNSMAWIIPLTLGFAEEDQVALVLEETTLNKEKVYRARTIIGLEEAYTDARLVGPVTAEWLKTVANT